MLIHRAEIKQYDSFSTIILTTGPRDFYYSMWNENQLSSYLHDISLEVWQPLFSSLAKVFG